ncbi:hypothetical protein CLV98_102498 [Dyadobacter jejuensis]|uniref:Carboxypeptidase family protein n=1 Tax=Dyadobacter jejuensis TaxID=1082580 RepID=A0A316AR20_9BACT|nr:hypothetical protein [Dyadobacter jejuensis]PWJ59664.1 hypothetical protein CLV98_102498 [Dyadobacter jejuensis]
MKRRQLLQFMALPLLLASSCKEKLLAVPMIVTGKVIDENGLPLEGAGLRLSGTNWKGFTPVPTFPSVTAESDKDGNYKLSQLIPNDTEVVSILPMSTDKVKVNAGYNDYITLVLTDGNYVQLGAPYDIPRSQWGKTTTLHYQYKKR